LVAELSESVDELFDVSAVVGAVDVADALDLDDVEAVDVGVAVEVEIDEDVAAGEAADKWLIAIQGNFTTTGNT